MELIGMSCKGKEKEEERNKFTFLLIWKINKGMK